MKRKDTKQFITKAMEVHNNKYNYSKTNYINNRTKVEIICPTHGVFMQTPDHHINQKQECPECNKYKKMTVNQFVIKAKKNHNDKYDYSKVNYINNTIKVEIICPIHGSFMQNPSHHINQKQGCPECGGTKKKNTKQFITKAIEVHSDKYDYSKTNYTTNKNKVEIICPIHGSFMQIPQDHSKGSGCPVCKSSKGEKEIENFLKINNIDFITQKTFDGCKDKNLLRFDFYLIDKNICIEYDGIQHFKKIDFWGGEKGLTEIKRRDSIKTEYCNENSISLLRIKYNESIANKLQVLN